MSYFIPEKDLRSVIIECLKDEAKSISRITRDLKGKGNDFHRLMITGYLKALADLGIIKEQAIPPSKVYSLPAHRRKNIYELIGDHVKAMNLGQKKEALLCTQVIQTLFKRPVFMTELNLAGFEEPPGIKKVSGEERAEAKALLGKAKIKIGPRDPAFVSKKPLLAEVHEVVANLFLDVSGSRYLRSDSKQTTLSL